MKPTTVASGDNEALILRSLVHNLFAPPLERAEIEPALQRLACKTYFVLSSENVAHFVKHNALEILAQMDRETVSRTGELQGTVRGRILWPETIKARATHAGGHLSFVCQQNYRQYDTPENQLLKYLVEAIAHCLRSVPDIIRYGTQIRRSEPPLRDAAVNDSEKTQMLLHDLETRIDAIRRSPQLRAVSLPTHIKSSHLNRALRAQNPHYEHAASLFRMYQAGITGTSWEPIGRRASTILLPGQLSSDGEFWIRLGGDIIRLGHKTIDLQQ